MKYLICLLFITGCSCSESSAKKEARQSNDDLNALPLIKYIARTNGHYLGSYKDEVQHNTCYLYGDGVSCVKDNQ